MEAINTSLSFPFIITTVLVGIRARERRTVVSFSPVITV